jgi:hypothetical protein
MPRSSLCEAALQRAFDVQQAASSSARSLFLVMPAKAGLYWTDFALRKDRFTPAAEMTDDEIASPCPAPPLIDRH